MVKVKETVDLINRNLNTIYDLDEKSLERVFKYSKNSYYNTGEPVFTDSVFDLIKDQLQKLNPLNSALKQVGTKVSGRKTKLPVWMGSLDKIKSEQKSIAKWVSNYSEECVISDKLDGNSALLEIKEGTLILYSRGDGYEGQNISTVLPYLKGIPKSLESVDYALIRGEIIISKKDFQKVSSLGANARNMASGILNSKTLNKDIAKYLQFVAYEIIEPENMIPSEQLALLKEWKFKTVYFETWHSKFINAESLSNFLSERRENSEFEIDGLVVNSDSVHKRVTGKNPKHAFAFKTLLFFDKAEVVVESVEWNVSKDGYLKPVVIFPSVSLNGVSIKRATGFNAKFIVDNKIGAGSRILIVRSGDVIPHIEQVLEESKRASLPKNVSYEWNETQVDIYVPSDNEDLAVKLLEYFFVKLKIDGLSSGIVDNLYSNKFDTVNKILNISKQELMKLEGFQEKLSEKIHTSIQKRLKEINTLDLMIASNTFGRGIGEAKLKAVSEKYPKFLLSNIELSVEELIEIPSVQEKTALAILEGKENFWRFVNEQNLHDFIRKGNKFNSNTLASLVAVFSGFRNTDLENYIVSNGGQVKPAVTKTTTVLIVKDKDEESSKVVKAREYGIKIQTLEEFKKYI